jgi:hypothetical protein
LVEVVFPAGTAADGVRVDVDGRYVRSDFAMRANRRYMGLVTGLAVGPNRVTARFAGIGQSIVITNHPIGGPVFAGSQVQPWICITENEGALKTHSKSGLFTA